MVDNEAIEFARLAGLTDHLLKDSSGSNARFFKTGCMSDATIEKMNYMKTMYRSQKLLKDWSKDGYWQRQREVLKISDPERFTDTIERINVNDLTVE